MRPDLSVYLVTDSVQCGDRGVVDVVRRAVSGGVTCVQVREKQATHGELVDLVRAVADAVADRASVIVDDRPEVVLCARAEGATVHGVHVGQDDGSPETARGLLGPGSVVGLTAHTPEHLAAAAELPPGTVDYLGVGVVAATPTKRDHPPVLGVDGFARLAAATAYPCVAIGGVGPGLVRPLRDSGAAGVAVVSAVCAAEDPERAAAELAREWHR